MSEAAGRAPARGLLRQIGAVSLVTGLSQVCFLAANLLLGRHLSPSDFGRVDLANKLINLTAYLGLFGLNSALIRSVPLADLTRYDWKAGIGRVAWLAAGITILITAGGGLLYRFALPETALMALAGWLFGLTVAGTSVLSIQRRFALAQALLYLWRPLLLVAAIAMLLSNSFSTRAVLVAYGVAGVAQVTGLLVALRRSSTGSESLPTRRLVSEGMLFFGLFMTSTLMLRLDSFLVAGLVNAAALGRYAAAANIALTGYGVLSLGVAQVLNPRVSSGEPLRLGRLVFLLLVAGGLAGVALTLAGTPLIHWLFKHRYEGDFTRLLGLFCLTGLLQVAYVVPSSLLGIRASLGTLRLFLLINVVSVGINAGLNIWLIPRHGLEGAALATLLSWVWRLAWGAGLARRLPATRPGRPELPVSA